MRLGIGETLVKLSKCFVSAENVLAITRRKNFSKVLQLKDNISVLSDHLPLALKYQSYRLALLLYKRICLRCVIDPKEK